MLALTYLATGNAVRGAGTLAASAVILGLTGIRGARIGAPAGDPLARSAVVALLALLARLLEDPVAWAPSAAVLGATVATAAFAVWVDERSPHLGPFATRLDSKRRSLEVRLRDVGIRSGRAVRSARPWRTDRWGWAARALIALTLAMHVWWLVRNRAGYGLELDEGRLLVVTDRMQQTIDPLSPSSFVRAWQADGVVAPLLSFLAVPVRAVTDAPAAPVVVVLGLLALLLATANALARRLAGPIAGLAAIVVLALIPGVIWFSRVFEQIVPGAALWLATLACIIRSGSLRSLRWRAGAGAALGLALVGRAMLVGFLPALVVALAVQQCALPRDERAKLRHVVQTFGLAAAIAATWWLWSWSTAIDYFRGAGYSTAAGADPADVGFSLAPARWVDETVIVRDLVGGTPQLIILAAAAAIGVAMGGWAAATRGRRAGRAGSTVDVRAAVATPEVFLAMVMLLGHATLVTSAQDFRGYSLLNVPILVVLAASALRVRAARIAAIPLAVVVLSYAPQSMDPGAGWMPTIAYPGAGVGLRSTDEAWPEFGSDSLEVLEEQAAERGARLEVVVATNRVLYSAVTMSATRSSGPPGYPILDLRGDALVEELTDGDLALANGAITAPPGAMESLGDVEAAPALEAAGFEVIDERTMPDGEVQQIWWRDLPGG